MDQNAYLNMYAYITAIIDIERSKVESSGSLNICGTSLITSVIMNKSCLSLSEFQTDQYIDIKERLVALEKLLSDPFSDCYIERLLDIVVACVTECTKTVKSVKNENMLSFLQRYLNIAMCLQSYRRKPQDFSFISSLGHGAFGRVQLVREITTGRVCAMKVLKKSRMLAQHTDYWAEREIMSHGESPWIVQLYYAYQDLKYLYMVMEYVPGGNLVSWMDEVEYMSEAACRFYAAETILALADLHAMGFIHRDLKPDNLLLDAGGHLKLADFGTAVRVDPETSLIHCDAAVGTPDYLSPEVLLSQGIGGGSYGFEVDWWALGVVIYEMLYGVTPFYSETLVNTYANIMNHVNSLKFPENVNVSEACLNFMKSLLCDRTERLGSQAHCLSEVEDWSSVTPHALTFLTAESVAESIVPNGSRRLICPRPFVDSKPRIHQWCWLLCPPSGTNSKLVQEWNYKFELETKELVGLFSEWLRAPRGLGGLTDAVLSILDFSISTMKSKNKHKNSTPSGKEKQHSQGSGCSSVGSTEVDSEPDECPSATLPNQMETSTLYKEEKADFQSQEAERFSHPWLPFVYHIQDYYAVVGPLRSAPSALNHELISLNSCRNWSGHSKARDHPLLRLDRPMFVSLSEIVRDAVACLPNGEGTRADITVLVQNSGFLLPNTNPRQLQQCVSSALDRLQGETSDPSVYFNSDRRMWIYRHRNRSVEQFAELHEARCAVYETKKIIQRGGNATSVNSISKRPNQFNPEKHSVYLSKHNSLRDSSSRISRRYQCSGGRQIQSGYVSRDYGYMELSGGYSLNEDDDHIPDIEELEAADEINMTEYSCTSASGSMDPYEVEVHEANNNMVDDEGDIDKVNYENEILSDWDDDKSTDRTVSYPTSQHDNHDLTKRVRYLDPFQSRSPTSFIMPSHNRSQATSAHNDTKHSRSQNSAFSSDSKRRYTNYDGSDAQFEDYVIDNEGIDEEYF
ncbi:unnamed protein product [Heterobilharzia americana]|nr:unnamed protein product [Heterobilharzia americana]